MMKYRNREYNKKKNEMLCNAGLLVLALAAGALGHVLVSMDSAAVAIMSIAAVLGALGISCMRSIRA